MFKEAVGGSTDSCNRCNISGLLQLSQYYSRLHEQKLQSDLGSEVESVSLSSSPEETMVEHKKSTFLEYLDRITFQSNSNSIGSWLHSSVSVISPLDESV